jgi:uncharacterized protein YyaL (SSP411 family)
MNSYKLPFGGLIFVCALFLNGEFIRADSAPPPTTKEIHWQPWSETVFAEAKRDHKFVLLDLQAVWCHWCHVMDAKTYSDPRVIALIQSHYIPVRVDQDAHPDLASRYQDYGWPATIVFNSDGREIVKRQGYLPAEQMTSMLQAIIDDPTPGPSVTLEKEMSYSSKPRRADAQQLRRQLDAGYDWKLGSWGTNQKFLNWDNTEYCLVQAQAGDAKTGKMVQQTLQAQLQLIDPVWGGVDQYSAEGDWNHPHFEKILQFQAENIRIYAQAFSQQQDPVYLKTAEGIYGYVREFLTSPDRVVYASQDADLVPGEHAGDYFKLNDADRRKQGIPKVDKHIYSRENGWFIQALAALYQVSGNDRYRAEAATSAHWIIAQRSIGGGGFRHGEERSGPLSLGDNLAMARAFLDLYVITADKKWLSASEQTASFIASHFAFKVDGKPMGYAATEDVSASPQFKPKPDFDENVSLARFANMLFHYTGNPQDRLITESALRFAASPEIANARLSSVGGLLLALKEFGSEPLHITIVGKKTDPRADDLFKTALSFPYIYKQVEWIDDHQSNSAEAIQYPELTTSAAFVCGQGTCSAPIITKDALLRQLKQKTGRQSSSSD